MIENEGMTMPYKPTLDRYEAAIRLERVRQQIRETLRYGFPITGTHREEMRLASEAYVRACDAARY